MAVFIPGRLLLARQRRALTLNQLASLSKITSTSLNAYENERQQPSRGSISSLSAALGFPVSFFSAPALAPIQQGWANLRRPSKLASRQRDGALSSATLAASINPWLEIRFHLPQPNVPPAFKGAALRRPQRLFARIGTSRTPPSRAWSRSSKPTGSASSHCLWNSRTSVHSQLSTAAHHSSSSHLSSPTQTTGSMPHARLDTLFSAPQLVRSTGAPLRQRPIGSPLPF
ncbi:helix-turn-helix transcriptional regulator [Streptomyces laculatispora]|nr:helix-turn-helix transcriptional regulator [Streptomyces laculatispora]